MPTKVFHPTTDPPRLWDRLRVHPMTNPVALGTALCGALLVMASVIPSYTPSQGLATAPLWLELLTGIMLLAGGLLAVVGLHWPGEGVDTGWAIERSGWALMAGGWLSTAIAMMASGVPGNSLVVVLILSIAAGSVGRFFAVLGIEARARRQVAELRTLEKVTTGPSPVVVIAMSDGGDGD